MEKETGLLRHIAETLIGKQGRKVAFGIWGFLAANAFLEIGKIDAHTWMVCFVTCMLLIGFGTLMDTFVENLGGKLVDVIAGVVGNRVSIISNKTTINANPTPAS